MPNQMVANAPRSRKAEPTVSESRLRVRYAETDQMKVVYNANYFVWFEIGRVEFMRQLGFTYKQMEEEDQTHLPVMEVRCRYKAPARYDDEIIVQTSIGRLHNGLVQFKYKVIRAEDRMLLAEGESTHVVVNKDMKRASFPEKYMAVLRDAAGKMAE